MSVTDTRPRGQTADLPLAVDLDGTLFRGDLFLEAILRFVFAQPLRIFVVIGWLLKGRAHAKARLAERAPANVADLPYNERVLAWLHEERARGRTMVLASASDRNAAQAVADHVGVFDAVFASDGVVNLKSARKAERLAAAFPDGFAYAGNESADVKVWRAAKRAVVVNGSESLARRAAKETEIEKTFPREGGTLRGLIKAIRPQQWAKNVLVYLPLLAGQAWMNVDAWIAATIAFFAMSFTASSVYLINDASDIDADRRHPSKKKRPFASGALSPAIGLVASAALLCAGLTLAATASVLLLVAAYLVLNLFYTFWLKRKRVVDIFLLTGFYMMRVLIGGVATMQYASTWLLAFCGFIFLSLSLVKRVTEVEMAAAGGGGLSRRGYLPTDGPILKMMGVSSAFVATLVLALYVQSDVVTEHYRSPFLLWALPAAAMFWLTRVWLLTERGEMHDDPVVFALRDRVSLFVAAMTALCCIAAVMVPASVWPIQQLPG